MTPEYYAAKERFRANVRQLLIYVLVTPLLVALLSGWLDEKYLETHQVSAIIASSLLIGAPIGVAIFILYKIIGFAFPSLDFTHRYRRR